MLLVSEPFASDTHATCGAQSGGRVFCISCCICTVVVVVLGWQGSCMPGAGQPFIPTPGAGHTVSRLTPFLWPPLLACMLCDWRHAVLLPQSGPGVAPLCLLSPHMHWLVLYAHTDSVD